MKPSPSPAIIAAILLAMQAGGARAQDAHGHHAHDAAHTSPAPPASETKTPDPHAMHRQPAHLHEQPREPVPVPTAADRAAAFPTLSQPMAHAPERHWRVLFDRIETHEGDHGRGQAWDAEAWVGGDTQRLWIRSEGERMAGHTETAGLDLLYGRAVSPWWELLAGVRQDFLPGDGQTRGIVGIQGMAPYRVEVAANAYIGGATRAAVTLELEYDMLLTNRLILQPVVEVALHARDDVSRGIGKGLGTVEGGLRLRYELDRRFAPYLGYSWSQTHGRTARLRENAGDPASDSGWLAGVRIWF